VLAGHPAYEVTGARDYDGESAGDDADRGQKEFLAFQYPVESGREMVLHARRLQQIRKGARRERPIR